jgi:DNA-3-methyladenine glycosylase II
MSLPDPSADQLTNALHAIAAADQALASFISRVGPPEERPGQGDHFAALARAIVFQQLAGSAARAIHARTVAALGGEMTAAAILAAPLGALRGAGLSGAKTVALVDLAHKTSNGTVPLDEIETLDDEHVVHRLVSVRGIGRWTAEMFMLFELHRPDVWPVDDFGVRNGWSLIHELPVMISPRELAAEGERFRPQRSLVARYCWQAVHVARANGGNLAPGGTAGR